MSEPIGFIICMFVLCYYESGYTGNVKKVKSVALEDIVLMGVFDPQTETPWQCIFSVKLFKKRSSIIIICGCHCFRATNIFGRNKYSGPRFLGDTIYLFSIAR